MATLSLNAALSQRKVAVTFSTSGSLSGSAALLIDNTLDSMTVEKLIEGLVRAYHRAKSKAAKPSAVQTSGTTLE